MKRTATLLAGLLLVTGTVFATESALDFSGSTIKVKTTLGTQATSLNDDSNGDTDYNLHLKYTLDNKTTATFAYTTDDNSDTYDDSLNVIVNRKEGAVEAQISAELNLGTNVTATNGNQKVFKENQDTADTFIKWNRTPDSSLAFFPFRMELKTGSMFDDGDNNTQIPGLVATMGNAYIGVGMDTVTSSATADTAANKTASEVVTAVKAGYSTKLAGADVSAKYSGTFFDEKKLTVATGANTSTTVGTAGRLGLVTQSVTLDANYDLTKTVKLAAELGYNVLAKDKLYLTAPGATTNTTDATKGGFGATAKVSYAMSNVVTPYVQVKYTQDGFLAYGDMEDFNTNSNGTKVETGGLLETIVGANYMLTKNLTLNGEATLKSAGEKIYSDNDGVGNKEKTAFTLAGAAVYTF